MGDSVRKNSVESMMRRTSSTVSTNSIDSDAKSHTSSILHASFSKLCSSLRLDKEIVIDHQSYEQTQNERKDLETIDQTPSNGPRDSISSDMTKDTTRSSFLVSFSEFSDEKDRDKRAWSLRLDREEVFYQSYKPTKEEQNEQNTIAKDLMLKKNDLGGLDGPGQEALRSIFFPRDHERKAVLLKRGPILLNGVQECELMLFTNGFLLREIKVDSLLKNVFAMNLDEAQSLTSEQLHERFDDIDSDGNGLLDISEIRQVFLDMGTPVGEETIYKIMDKFDEDCDGMISFDEFESALHDYEVVSKFKEHKNQNLWGSLVGGMKKSVSGQPEVNQKIDSAYTLSDIEKVECANISESEDNLPGGEINFAIFIEKRNNPLVMVCSKPLECFGWVNVFQKCLSTLPTKNQDKRVQRPILDREYSRIDWGDCDSDDEDW